MRETAFARALLSWFKRAKRDLPWRRIRTPYSTWISEVMLQQTVVAAVAPRFESWLKMFPDARALAAAPLSDVLRAWEGLGYYSRARNLHAAAVLVSSLPGGVLPRTREELRALPGIGEYTAAAILSLAYGLPHPVLDANVKRVIQRFLGERIWTPDVERKTRAFLERHISMKRPGDFNEAMMELGALVCIPRSPRCSQCPVSSACKAHELGTAHLIPERRAKTIASFTTTIVIARHKESVWLVDGSRVDQERPSKPKTSDTKSRFLAGFEAFPRFSDVAAHVARRHPEGRPLPCVVHTYLAIREELHPVLVKVPRRVRITVSAGRWVLLAELDTHPMPTAHRKIARMIPGAGPASFRGAVPVAVPKGARSRRLDTRPRAL